MPVLEDTVPPNADLIPTNADNPVDYEIEDPFSNYAVGVYLIIIGKQYIMPTVKYS